jgi:leucyl/phenylalanyl-tRNA--protein transferase
MMVGVQGFEPWTPWSQTRCATRLRHTPTASILTRQSPLTEWCPKKIACPGTAYKARLKMPSKVLPWLDLGACFPDPSRAWDHDSEAPGLLAAGGSLDASTLFDAYSQGIFPWFSDGQPILWWSPNPRMVLRPENFRLHHSLRKTIRRFGQSTTCEIRVDSAFASVIHACACASRTGQSGTWIMPAMVQAYIDLHAAGYAHSIETWIDGNLVGGLYCVAIGNAIFGESMFAQTTDASKIALTALIALCREYKVEMIDCQQNTRHLASLGASEIPRAEFLTHVSQAATAPGLPWQFSALYWQHVLSA